MKKDIPDKALKKASILFKEETKNSIKIIKNILIEIEKDTSIPQIKNIFHRIKGGASFLQLEKIKNLALKAENLIKDKNSLSQELKEEINKILLEIENLI